MSATPPASRVAPAKRARNSVPLLPEAGKDAKRLAAVILEVWAGLRTPLQAAETLSVSLPRYYQIEANGLQGLVAGCTPKSKGRQVNPAREATALRQDNERLRRELGRQQALIRLTQRGLGVAPPAAKPATPKKGRRRKPVVRALTLAARLQPDVPEPEAGSALGTATATASDQG
jgi:hypothetical protein